MNRINRCLSKPNMKLLDGKTKPCPFCKSTDLSIQNSMLNLWWIECNACLTEGPIKRTEKGAMNIWNKAKR